MALLDDHLFKGRPPRSEYGDLGGRWSPSLPVVVLLLLLAIVPTGLATLRVCELLLLEELLLALRERELGLTLHALDDLVGHFLIPFRFGAG